MNKILVLIKGMGVWAVLLLCSAIIALSAASPSIAISQKMAYEGNLYDSSGNPLTGSYNMRFSIVRVSGGSSAVIWGPETHTGVSVSRGWFSVMLGEEIAIEPSSFNDSSLYLRIEVANPPTSSNYELMTPSTAIVSVGSAFKAIEAQTAITVADGSITAAKLAAGAVTKEAILTSNSPADNQYLRWNSGNLEWASVSGGGSTAEADNVTIGTNVYGSLEVKDLGISSTKISTSAVTAEKLASGAVTLESIAASNSPTSGQYLKWSGSQLQWATVSGGTGSVEPDEITITTNVNGSIEVKDAGISGNKISSAAITEPKIASGAVTAGAIASGAVTTPKIAGDIDITTSGSVGAVSIAGKHYGDGSGLTGITASTANYANIAGIATSAATATTANYAVLSGTASNAAIAATASTANYSVLSGIASTAATATNATIADYASLSGIASIAASATTANYSTLSGTATTAATAITANYSVLSGAASTAAIASTATTANYSVLSGTASIAAVATAANYATLSGTASTAATASYAAISGTASAAATAATADYAVLSGTASVADRKSVV